MPPLDAYRPGPGDPPLRPSVPERYRWDLSAVCASWDEWTERYQELERLIDAFRQFQGTLGQSGPRLLEALKAAIDQGVKGKEITPFLLSQLAERSEGSTLKSNIALLENNARVASEIAMSLNY